MDGEQHMTMLQSGLANRQMARIHELLKHVANEPTPTSKESYPKLKPGMSES